MKRDAGVELLDGALDEPAVLRDNLRDMGRANRLTGGTVLSLRAIDALAPPDGALSVLDVGTGGADIPVALLADPRFWSRVTVTATDSRPEVLDAARAVRPGLDRIEGLRLEVADGRALPYADGTFDIGHASLVLHHIEPTDAPRFLRELARVSRRGIVLNDLSRRPITVLGAWLLSRVCTHNPYSRHDAPLSARRAYTFDEAMTFVLAAGLRPVYSAEFVFGHRWVIAAIQR
jgi:ubiquinone/menaquinone biosynthesis C-methylase UbiE